MFSTFKLLRATMVTKKMRLAHYVFIFLAVSLIASCSVVKTTYNNAPTLIIWRLDDFFDLTQAQTLALKPSLQRLHDWHRQTQLPIYVTLLQNTQASLANAQISAGQTCEKIDAIRLAIRAMQIESISMMIEMAPLLSDNQLVYFQNELAERAEKWKSDWWQETAEQQLDVRLEKAQDFAEDVYGSLDDAQIALLKQSFTKSPLNPALYYQEIQRRNQDAVEILNGLQKQILSVEEKSLRVKAGFDRLQKSPNQDYQIYADNLKQQTCATIVSLHASTNAEQKAHAKHWLQDYITQLTALQKK